MIPVISVYPALGLQLIINGPTGLVVPVAVFCVLQKAGGSIPALPPRGLHVDTTNFSSLVLPVGSICLDFVKGWCHGGHMTLVWLVDWANMGGLGRNHQHSTTEGRLRKGNRPARATLRQALRPSLYPAFTPFQWNFRQLRIDHHHDNRRLNAVCKTAFRHSFQSSHYNDDNLGGDGGFFGCCD